MKNWRITVMSIRHTWCLAGLHKLWYPGIRDTSTWSKFGAHGEHGDVFLFSNLGALWFSENLIRYSLQGKSRIIFFPSNTLIYGISRDGSKNFNICTCEHMILGQLRIWARPATYAALDRTWPYLRRTLIMLCWADSTLRLVGGLGNATKEVSTELLNV